jgi:hypothetical protein
MAHKFIVAHACYKKGLFQSLTQNNIMKSCKNEPKTSHTIPYIFTKRNEWIINPINLHLLNILIHQIQADNIMPPIIL